MDKKIVSFIESQKNMTLCTAVNDSPYCANCFYAYLESDNLLVFKSARETLHICNALLNNNVAGTIIPDVSKIGTIKGIQFTGKFMTFTGSLSVKAKRAYYKMFPFALPMKGELWGIKLLHVKMTDNTLGLGKKIIWEAPVSVNKYE